MKVSMWNPTPLREQAWPPRGLGWGWGRGHGMAAGGTRTDSRMLSVERTRTSDVQLQIRTDEGDTVTLTLHAESDALAVSYRSRTRGEDGRSKTAAELRSLTTTREVSITVEGSLDEREQAAVDALAAQVERAVQGFFQGGAPIADALAQVGSDPLMEPLAGFQLDVSRTQTLDVLLMRMRSWTRDGGVTALPQVAPAPAEPPASDDAGPGAGAIADAKRLPIGRRSGQLVA